MAAITGTSLNDVITGTTLADVIDGGEGNDRINGGAGNDLIFGGPGNDTLTGDAGNDQLVGGDGNDGFFGGGGDDLIQGEAGDDTMYGDAGNDVLEGGAGNDKLFGGSGDDTLIGGTGTNTYDGGLGADTIIIELPSSGLTPGVLADLASLKNFMDGQLSTAGSVTALSTQSTGPTLTLSNIGLTLSNVETPVIKLDGVVTPLASFLNSPPVAPAAVALTVDEDHAISGNVGASDANGDPLSYVLAQGPANGTLTLDPGTGDYIYTPGGNFAGTDSFKIAVSDPAGAGLVQTVTVGVAPVNDAPVAQAEVAVSGEEDGVISGQVVASDIDGDILAYALSTGPQSGTLVLNAATGAFTYTPDANFNGTDSFKVAIADPSGAAVIQTVTLGVAAVNDAPVAGPDQSLNGTEDTAITGIIPATDLDGDALSFSVANVPAHGTLSLDAKTGAYVYTPAAGWSGTDAFEVAVSDPSGASAVQRVDITLSAVADTPALIVVNPVVVPAGEIIAGLQTSETLRGTAGADTISGNKGDDNIDATGSALITVGLDIGAALGDLDGSETLSIRVSNLPAGGVLSAGLDNGDGSWSLTLQDLAGLKLTADVTSGFTVQVEATATESSGQTAKATASIDVILSPDANLLFGGTGNDTIKGGAGNDIIYGNSGNDVIYGNGGDDTIYGGKGNDTISGGTGDNKLNGNSGDDTFIADAGNDTISGGSGFDILDYSGVTAGITADLSRKTITGAASGTDTVSGVEKIIGSTHADTFKGSSANDIIDGGAGNDTLRGIAGSDTLTGGSGADTFFWEKSDVVSSTTGAHLGVDHITDFGAGDVLDFRKLVGLGTKAIQSMVKITDTAEGSVVSARIGTTFKDVAVLDNVHGVTAAELFHDGHLLVG